MCPTLVLPLLYVWIMFSAPCFTFSSMASCFSRPATRLRLAAEQAGPPSPGDRGASGERWVRQSHQGPPLHLPRRFGPAERICPLPNPDSIPGQDPEDPTTPDLEGNPSVPGRDQHEWASVQVCMSPQCWWDYEQRPLILYTAVWRPWV